MEPTASMRQHDRRDQDVRTEDEHVLGLADIEVHDAADEQVAEGQVEETPEDVDRRPPARGRMALSSAGKSLSFSVVMTRRLFTVVIQTEIIVLADDEAHAEIVAKQVVENEWLARDLRASSFKFQAQPMSHVPVGWDENGFPEDNTLEEPERTIRELIELGAAPRMCS
jgi:hypothetical protein